MAENSSSVPKIRFKGFVDAWTQRKLGDYFNITSGFAFKMDDYVKTGVLIVNGESIQHGIVSSNNWSYLPLEFQKKYSSFLLKTDDIVLGLNRPITNGNLKIAKIPKELNDTLLYQRAGKIDFIQEVDKDFSYYVLGAEVKQFVLKEAVGSDQPFISTTKFKDWSFKIPNKLEQAAIGKFFCTLDEIITATQRKVTGLKQLKRAYLQQMFPQAGEKVPRVRFGGFSGDWEIKTIESFADVKTGRKDTQDAISSGEYDFYVRSPKIEKINSYSFDGEAILTVGDGVGVGKVFHYVNGKFDYHQRVYKISDFNDVYGLFFYQYFAANFIKESQKYNAKTSVDSVRREMITKMLIPCPAIEEQITIGDFFHNLDTQITAQFEKAEKLKQLKSAYLQKMFI